MGKPTLLATAFGQWIAKLRRGRSYEQVAGPIRELLKPTGMKVHPSQIVKVEQGRVPNALLLFGLSRVLKVPMDEMLARLLQDLNIAGVEAPEDRDDAATTVLSIDERELLAEWNRLTPSARDTLRAMMAEIHQAATRGQAVRESSAQPFRRRRPRPATK